MPTEAAQGEWEALPLLGLHPVSPACAPLSILSPSPVPSGGGGQGVPLSCPSARALNSAVDTGSICRGGGCLWCVDAMAGSLPTCAGGDILKEGIFCRYFKHRDLNL